MACQKLCQNSVSGRGSLEESNFSKTYSIFLFGDGSTTIDEILFFWEDEHAAIPAMGFDQTARDLTHSHVSGW